MIKFMSTTTYFLDFDVVALKTKLAFEDVVVLLALSCPTSLDSTIHCAVDEVEGGSLHVLLSSSPLVLDSPNLQYLYCFGIVTSGKSESDSSGKSGNSYSELVESKIHSLIWIHFGFCSREMVYGARKQEMEKLMQITYFGGRQHLIIFILGSEILVLKCIQFFSNILNFK